MKRYASYQETGILWNTNIPAHWKLYRGKRMFFTEKHLNVDRAENNILSLTLNGVVRNNGDKPIGLSPADYSTYQIFEKDNLVFKLIDLNNISTSRVGLVPERGIMSSAYIRLIPRFEVNIRYFYMQYYDLWLRNIFNGLGAGVRQTLGAKELLELEIAVPPREEQDQIVRFLDWKVSSINKLINIKKNMIALLEERKKAIINSVLTGGATGVACKESVIADLSSIPITWDERPLKFYASSNDESLSSKTPNGYEFAYIDISTAGFRKLKKEPVRITFKEAPSRARRIVREGDTILSTVRTYLKAILYIDNTKDGNIVSTGFSVLRPRDGVYPPLLSYALSCDYFINAVIRNSIGVSYPAINDKQLLSLKIALPKAYDEQVKIHEQITMLTESTENAISHLQDIICNLQDLKTRLISDVVTGKIDVRDIDIPDYEFTEEVPDANPEIDGEDELSEQEG